MLQVVERLLWKQSFCCNYHIFACFSLVRHVILALMSMYCSVCICIRFICICFFWVTNNLRNGMCSVDYFLYNRLYETVGTNLTPKKNQSTRGSTELGMGDGLVRSFVRPSVVRPSAWWIRVNLVNIIIIDCTPQFGLTFYSNLVNKCIKGLHWPG